MSPTYLFLPAGDGPFRWTRVEDGVLVEGDGLPPERQEVIAVAPADAVALHWAELPTRSPAQATAAARLLVAEASAAPVNELHVAVGDEGAPERPIGVVDLDRMRRWLLELQQVGVDPVAIIPAPLLIPAPAEGYTRAELGGEGLVRGPGAGFADEARLTELLTGGAAPATIGRDELARALAERPPALDLRQGPFAKRQRFAIDWRLLRRLAWYGVAILLVTVAITLVRITRYSFGADALEARADAVARQGLPRGVTVSNAARQLDARLTALQGPGQGFSGTVAAVYAAVQAVPGAELTALDFQSTGALRIGVATNSEAGVNDLKRGIEGAGFAVDAGTFTDTGGRFTGEFTVTPR